MSMTMVTNARAKKRGMSRVIVARRVGKTTEVGVEMEGGRPSFEGYVGVGVLVGVSRGKGVAEGVEVRKGGEVMVGLGRGVKVDVAVAVGVGVCVAVGVG